MRVQEIRVQREDHLRFIEPIMRLDNFPERTQRSFTHIIASNWLKLMPFRLREFLEPHSQLRGEGWRGNGLRQESQSSAFVRAMASQDVIQLRQEPCPRADVARTRNGLRPIGIVEIKN